MNDRKNETLQTLGMLGLGRMGGNMARRLLKHGHSCVVWDRDSQVVADFCQENPGARGAASLEDFVSQLPSPKLIWMMVPAAVTPRLADQIEPQLNPGDILIDGGNSHYRDAVDRSQQYRERGVFYVDVGTSGGVHGLERGYCLMIGGEREAFEKLEPIFATLAPGVGSVERTPGRDGYLDTEELGYLHCGPSGAGHFVKMVHNGIEYGLMAAYAEGFNILRHAGIGNTSITEDAETAPLKDRKYYQYDFQLEKVAELWRRGSVIPSWLLDLTAQALLSSPSLTEFGGKVADSGEGRWTQLAAIDEGVPAHVLSAALFDRFSSRGRGEFASQVLSAMRLGFGGHVEKKR
jgi:6-phosphogluconate dehydrogenase